MGDLLDNDLFNKQNIIILTGGATAVVAGYQHQQHILKEAQHLIQVYNCYAHNIQFFEANLMHQLQSGGSKISKFTNSLRTVKVYLSSSDFINRGRVISSNILQTFQYRPIIDPGKAKSFRNAMIIIREIGQKNGQFIHDLKFRAQFSGQYLNLNTGKQFISRQAHKLYQNRNMIASGYNYVKNNGKKISQAAVVSYTMASSTVKANGVRGTIALVSGKASSVGVTSVASASTATVSTVVIIGGAIGVGIGRFINYCFDTDQIVFDFCAPDGYEGKRHQDGSLYYAPINNKKINIGINKPVEILIER